MRGSNGGRAHGLRRRVSLLLAGVSAVGLASAGLAHAADADADSSSDSDQAAQVQGLTVTGAPQVVTTVPTPKQVFASPETIRVTDEAQMQDLGPVVGGAQGFGLNPGAYVNGYGATGATKYTIALDGVGQGWGGYNGYTGGASLMVTLDGVPIVDPATGLWSSAAFPSLSMFQAQQVTYGPGEASNRWYDNIGGAIEFTPLQPTRPAGGIISGTAGSYGERMVDFSFQTGEHNGWAGVLAGSYGASNDFRIAPDGFASPSDDYVLYGKVVKSFSHGDIDWGAYFARGEGFRPQVIPVNPNPQITLNGETAPGTPIAGALYSEKTSGFYSTLPFANYEKFDINQLAIAYNKINYELDDTAEIKNVAYYVLENRWHIRMNDVFPIGAANVEEFNNPYTYWFGDKVSLTKTWGFNTFGIGGWAQYTEYNTHQAFFNPALGGSRFDPNAHYRSGYFHQIDTALYAQDAIRPWPNLLIEPGIRLAGFWTSYGDGAPFDFPAAFAAFPGNDQGALGNALPPYAHKSYFAPEPSVEVSYSPFDWLNLYGSYETAYKTPQVGGGGGPYQAVAASLLNLAYAQEYQIGFKFLFNEPQMWLGSFDFGANYFYLSYAKQTITTTLANGTGVTAFGNSYYEGANFYADDNPIDNLHFFINASIVQAIYTSYFSGPALPNGQPNFAAGAMTFNGSHVPYVPTSTLNIGADYKIHIGSVLIDPYILFQYTGDQYIFNNVTVAPSNQTLAGYPLLNLGFHGDVPVTFSGKPRDITFSLAVQNVANSHYNSYLFLSSGGYFGTTNNGYQLAYPGAPITVYGSVGFAF